MNFFIIMAIFALNYLVELFFFISEWMLVKKIKLTNLSDFQIEQIFSTCVVGITVMEVTGIVIGRWWKTMKRLQKSISKHNFTK